MSWDPSADRDPVPGDPEAIHTAARRLAGLAEALAERAGEVKAADVGSSWVGLAAARFADHRDQVPPALDAAARRCQAGAEALRRYAPELADAQELAAEALRRARQAQDDLAAAERGLDAMDAHARAPGVEAESRNAKHGPDMYPSYLDLVDRGEAAGHIETPLVDLARTRRLVPDRWFPYPPR